MKVVIQRVRQASVKVDDQIVGSIHQGFLILLGVGKEDNENDIDWLVNKISKLRVFSDENDKMNLSINDINGDILVISQFTLFASTKKGNRPSFIQSAPPEKANRDYELFCKKINPLIKGRVEKGVFATDMKVSLLNDGPVTILMDSKAKV